MHVAIPLYPRFTALDAVGPYTVLAFAPGWTVTFVAGEGLVGWIRQAHEHTQWTTSVCSGSLLLGAAGLLEGRKATTHWAILDFLTRFGAEPVSERVVTTGKIVTAAGVSAGIDMALTLLGQAADPVTAQSVQLAIEYDPRPPFTCGSPATAPEGLAERALGLIT